MSDEPTPKQPPQLSQPPRLPARDRARPTGLTAVCVIAIVLGVMGLLGAAWTLVWLVGGQGLQREFAAAGGAGAAPELRRVQTEMQQEMSDVTASFRMYYVPVIIFNLAVAGCLLYGGIATLALKAAARRLLIRTFMAAICFEIIRGVLAGFVQLKTAAIMGDYLPRIMEASGPPGTPMPQAASQMGSVVAQVIMVLTLVIVVVLALVKIIYYIVGIRYLGKPKVRRLFDQHEGIAQK